MSGDPNRLIVGRYRLSGELGRGGMGAVWRADDELLGREVAVKEVLLPPGLSDDARVALCERALREARAAARLEHPAIIQVYDVVVDDERPWIVMRLVQGRSLDQVVRADGPLSPRQAARIGLNVLDGLRAAHAEGILHRDVTPRNVLLGDDGRVVLTDFGIAAIAGATELTQTGAVVGAPGYISPERLRGESPGPESDLWSLGATLYLAVEGRPAYLAETAAARAAKVLTGEPEPFRLAGPLEPVLKGLLAKEPAGRLSADLARRRLEHLATAPEPTAPEPTVRPPERDTGRRDTEEQEAGRPGTPDDVTRAMPERIRNASPANRMTGGQRVGCALIVIVILAVLGVAEYPDLFLEEGRFSTTPSACGSVPAELVDRLAPGTSPAVSAEPVCVWSGPSSRRPLARLWLNFALSHNSQWTSAPDHAHASFAESRSQAKGLVQGLASLGDEAFTEEVERPGEIEVTVRFRSSNVLCEAGYEVDGAGVNAADVRSGAIAIARQAAERLTA
jgi:serine/threonine protein kinase